MTRQEMLDILRRLDAEKLPVYERDELMYKGIQLVYPDVDACLIASRFVLDNEELPQ